MTPQQKVIIIKPSSSPQEIKKDTTLPQREKTILQRITEIVVTDIKTFLGIQERRISSQEISRGIESTLKMVQKK